MIEIFEEVKRMYEQEGDKYFIDKYVLTEGIYIRINKDLSITEDDILVVKSKKNEEYDFDLYRWFRERDFLSKIIYDDANKCIDTNEKKIHSINPYSLILKRINLPDSIQGLAKNTLKTVDDTGLSSEAFFEIVLDLHFKKMESLYDCTVDYQTYKERLSEKAKEAIPLISNLNAKDNTRIKMFLDEEVMNYQVFFNEYMKGKAFADKTYNEDIEGQIQGVLGYNNSLNSRKPTLLMRTTSFQAPYRVSIEDAILFYKMSLIIHEVKKETTKLFEVNGVGEVQNYEMIRRDKGGLYREFNILQVKEPADILEEVAQTWRSRTAIEEEVNRTFLKGLLYAVYKVDDSGDVSDFLKSFQSRFTDMHLFNELVMNRTLLKGYFVKHYDVDIYAFFEKILSFIMVYEIENAPFPFYGLREKWDKQMSVLHYFSGGKKRKDMSKRLKQLIIDSSERLRNEEIFEVEDDESYYFLLGQIASYLVSQSQTKNKSGRMFTPFLQSRNSQKIKAEMRRVYDLYAYNLPVYSQAPINKAIQAVNAYAPTKSLMNNELTDMLHAGIIGSNIFYMKKEKPQEREVEAV
ncbi:hypothetical protein PP175_28635 (plasmid) [Aneurinibacillus sp. Ricciae_BoGa-3]|uniref:hypothetical protein n=1 Tax=Aneurinibacillus sp. Ricciae_BoGa-3 TaxID=3022697 RepID=UPI0023409C1D|nr:hypothetical protein [Aneurinibacillus sp. Ricciae_BoGa-3]WCK57157.1 hypothetical protein PP175_28635 [Aneurinibacillus sp. Ricciae_BoGa-3]